MKRLKWLVVFLVISFPSFAQQFLLVEDTVRINAKDYISPFSRFEMKWAAKYHGYYFCIILDQNIFEGWNWKNRLLVISEDGKETVEVKWNSMKVVSDVIYDDDQIVQCKRSSYRGKTDNYEEKVEEVRQILTCLTNHVPVTITDNSTYWMWTYHNLTIKLYEGGRMVMYLTEK